MDRRDYERLFNRYYLPLGMYSLRITEDTDLAQDVVQEVFAGLWRRVMEGNAKLDSPASYLYRAVRNRSLSAVAGKTDYDDIEDVALSEPVAEEDQVILFTVFADHQGSAGFFPFHNCFIPFPLLLSGRGPERPVFDDTLLLYHF